MINTILHGCSGRMGHIITEICEKDENIEIVAGVDAFGSAYAGYPVFRTLDECPEADVIIDFSNSTAIDGLLEYSVRKNVPAVVCTTGLSEEQMSALNKASEKTAILKSANMSVGINLLEALIAEAAPKLAAAGFDVEIVEKHHNQKIDAPSGTAIMLANAINETLDNSKHYVYDRHSRRQKREKSEIGMHSIRGGTIVGEHDIIFAGNDEVITLSHSAASKMVFAEGAVNAAVFLKDKPAGLYDMSQMV